jgi:hypothetical protein
MYDPRVESKAKLIVYHVEINESIHLSDKSRHDIFHTVRECAAYFKSDSDKLREENHALRWNELKLYLKREKPDNYEQILHTMSRLDKKESIR